METNAEIQPGEDKIYAIFNLHNGYRWQEKQLRVVFLDNHINIVKIIIFLSPSVTACQR